VSTEGCQIVLLYQRLCVRLGFFGPLLPKTGLPSQNEPRGSNSDSEDMCETLYATVSARDTHMFQEEASFSSILCQAPSRVL
jgi:hypothetical protein